MSINFINFLNNSQSFRCIFIKLSCLALCLYAQPFNSSCKLGLRWTAHILTHIQPGKWHTFAISYSKLKTHQYYRTDNNSTAILSALYFLWQWGLQLFLPIWGALLYCYGIFLFYVYTKTVLLPFYFPCLVTFFLTFYCIYKLMLNISLSWIAQQLMCKLNYNALHSETHAGGTIAC